MLRIAQHVALLNTALFSSICLLVAVPAHSITIDEFSGSQSAQSSSAQVLNSSLAATPDAIGGTRGMQTQLTGGTLSLSLETGLGVLSHSQDANVTGVSITSWDGDSDPSTLDYSGLGGIDLSEDSATAIRFEELSYDFPGAQQAFLIVRLYDASDPSGATWSEATYALAQSLFEADFDIPFVDFTAAGPNGAADITRIGAITLRVDGPNPAADIVLGWFGTNGTCRRIPQNGRVLDDCGICGGDNSSCADCLGVPNGSALPGMACDTGQLGICAAGTYSTACICERDNDPVNGVCGGKDCAGVVDGTAVLDRCSVCEGDGQSCLGCNGYDQAFRLGEMDGGAKKQERNVKKIVASLLTVNNSKRNRNFASKAKKQAFQLQFRNWTLSWTELPRFVLECANTLFCTQTSYKSTIDEYLTNNDKLYKLALKALRRFKRASKGKANKKALSAKATSQERRATQLHKRNSELALEVPEFQSECS